MSDERLLYPRPIARQNYRQPSSARQTANRLHVQVPESFIPGTDIKERLDIKRQTASAKGTCDAVSSGITSQRTDARSQFLGWPFVLDIKEATAQKDADVYRPRRRLAYMHPMSSFDCSCLNSGVAFNLELSTPTAPPRKQFLI
jgi:hypothetical protein